MIRLIILFFVLVIHVAKAGDLDDDVKEVTDSLKSIGIEKVFVFQYSQFTGRYNIPYDDDELKCDSIPTVAHIFWDDNGRWKCQRLDFCGRFEIVNVKANFRKLYIDTNIEFQKKSAHFRRYQLTKLYNGDAETVYISGMQMSSDRNSTIRTFRKIDRLIERLEDSRKFKRV